MHVVSAEIDDFDIILGEIDVIMYDNDVYEGGTPTTRDMIAAETEDVNAEYVGYKLVYNQDGSYVVLNWVQIDNYFE